MNDDFNDRHLGSDADDDDVSPEAWLAAVTSAFEAGAGLQGALTALRPIEQGGCDAAYDLQAITKTANEAIANIMSGRARLSETAQIEVRKVFQAAQESERRNDRGNGRITALMAERGLEFEDYDRATNNGEVVTFRVASELVLIASVRLPQMLGQGVTECASDVMPAQAAPRVAANEDPPTSPPMVSTKVVELRPKGTAARAGRGLAAAPAANRNPILLPAFSDEALAVQFAHLHAPRLRYCAKWGRWLVWTGRRWEPDETLLATNMVRTFCREAACDPAADKQAKSIASAKVSAAVERLARADQRLAARAEQWDVDLMLLNTPAGVVDLRTGKISPSDPDLHMTKIAAVSPEAGCPTWLAFLGRITGGDDSLQDYIQRMLGYALTGDTSAQAMFFGYGTGANGKSVLIDTAAGILGDYHRNAPIEVFAESKGERHPTELARLHGARLVTAVETEEGRPWAEARVKSLTGGDKITARFMRQDFFEYQPQFKLLIAGNHKPSLRTVDEAIRRRFNLIPFAVTIPEGERDLELKDKLKAEWGGILAWMIEGCLKWQSGGLAAPAVVRNATDVYLEAEDAFGAWVDECCEVKASAWGASGHLFASWRRYAEDAGEKAGTQKSFSQKLATRGFQSKRISQARGFEGIRLRHAGEKHEDL